MLGKHLTRISSILVLLYGAASVLALALFVFRKSPERFAFADHMQTAVPALAMAVLAVKTLLQLTAGVGGLSRRLHISSGKLAALVGVLCLLFSAADIALILFSGYAPSPSEIIGYVLELLFPVLYIAGRLLD